MPEATITISCNMEVDVQGTFCEADPSVGIMQAYCEDPSVEGISLEIEKGRKYFHSKPSETQKKFLETLNAKQGSFHDNFLVTRAELRSLCRAVPEWLEEAILEKYSDEIQEALCEDRDYE